MNGKNRSFIEKISPVLFVGLLILGFVVRLYRFDNPIADWHSFRQSDTAAVAKVYVENGISALYPTYFDISNIQSGLDNPNGYRFVEFPVYSIVHAVLFTTIDILPFDQWGRLINIIGSLVTAVVLFLLLKKYVGRVSAFGAFFVFLFFPYSIFYSRVILPDVLMTTSIMLGIYFFDKWIEKEVKDRKSKSKNILVFVLSASFTALALLLKPFALFFTLPMLYLAFRRFGFSAFKRWHLWLFLILALLPLVLWRLWISQFPEGVAASSWLFNGGDIRFTGAYFYWIFGERIGKLILGFFGSALLIFGFLKIKREQNYLFLLSFVVSSLLYLVVIARGNVQHDYYQILIFPTICILVGRGIQKLIQDQEGTNRYIGTALVGVVLIFSIMFSWYFVRDYFNINNPNLVEAGRKADEILPKDALVIAPYDGDTTLLYYINRKGWPAFSKSIEGLIAEGADYLVLVNPSDSDIETYSEKYFIVENNPKYLIVKLTK